MKYLIVVDMQNDFITGSLGTDEAKAIVPNVVEKIKKCVKDGVKVLFTQDTHYPNYLETQEGRNLPVEHCVIHTHGWNVCSEISDLGVYNKSFFKESFGSVGLAKYLKTYRFQLPLETEVIEEIELVGLCSDICVISNALLIKSFLPEVKITVDASCCAGVTPESHKNALNAMKMCQINVVGE